MRSLISAKTLLAIIVTLGLIVMLGFVLRDSIEEIIYEENPAIKYEDINSVDENGKSPSNEEILKMNLIEEDIVYKSNKSNVLKRLKRKGGSFSRDLGSDHRNTIARRNSSEDDEGDLFAFYVGIAFFAIFFAIGCIAYLIRYLLKPRDS